MLRQCKIDLCEVQEIFYRLNFQLANRLNEIIEIII